MYIHTTVRSYDPTTPTDLKAVPQRQSISIFILTPAESSDFIVHINATAASAVQFVTPTSQVTEVIGSNPGKR